MQKALCCFVVGLIATSLGQGDVAQRRPSVRPDFSGKWTLTMAPAVSPSDPLGREGVISQDESSIRFTTGDRSTTYKIDGRDTSYEATVWKRVYQARWVTNALLITELGRFGASWEDAMILSLDGAGNLLLVTVNATTSTEPVMKTQLLTYRRSQGTSR